MKKISKLVIVALFVFLLCNLTVFAAGNEWVMDEPNVLSIETVDYVKNLNENVFSNYRSKPQLGVIIIERLPQNYTIDEYKLEKFNEYGIGTSKENCGMLFVFSLQDRKYGFEIGDGFKRGSLLRKDLEEDFITSDMKSLLGNGEYDTVTFQIVKHLEKIMADEENGVYEQREIEYAKKAKREKEQVDKFMNIFIVILIFSSLIYFIYHCITRFAKRNKIKKLVNLNNRYFNTLKISQKDFSKQFYKDVDLKFSNDEFFESLYRYYICKSKAEIESKCNNYEYVNYFKSENTYKKFMKLDLKSVDDIIYELDKKIEEEERIKKKNYENIHNYVIENKSSIENKEISIAELEKQMKSSCKKGELLEEKQINEIFLDTLKELNFRYEYESFISQNKKMIDTSYLNSRDLYNELRNSDEYRRYSYCNRYSNAWMLPFLVAHMENNRNNEIRRQSYSNSSHTSHSSFNSGFGSGFGGGFSSGGGFSGGW